MFENPYDKYMNDYERRKEFKNRGEDTHMTYDYDKDKEYRENKEYKYRSVYKTKNFDRKYTMAPYEKEEVDSRFTYKTNPITRKEVLISIIMFIIVLIMCDSISLKRTYFTVVCYILLFMLVFISLLYDVKKKYYYIILWTFLIVFLMTKKFSFFPTDEELGITNNSQGQNKKK